MTARGIDMEMLVRRGSAAMRHRRVLGVLAASLWAVAIAAGASAVIAGKPVAAPASDAPIPVLTAPDRADAKRLASAELTSLVGADRFAIRDVGVWHTHGKRKLGAVVVAQARGGGPYAARWPAIDYDRTETSAQGYADDAAQYTASGIDEFLVLVDLRRGRVVQVEPQGMRVKVSDVVGDPRRRTQPFGD